MTAQTITQTIKVLVVMGTRPEVIKLASVIEALKNNQKGSSTRKNGRPRFKTVICLTGQHREMVEPFLKIFGIKPDYDLRVMQSDQHLTELTGRVLSGMKKVLEAEQPDWVLVQGDTTSAMAAALAAFYQRVRIGHVEAGLRTEDKYNPFPEEINRRLISHLADLHFAPTELARKNLLSEGIKPEKIFVTGNTVVDALKMILKKSTGEKGKNRGSAGRCEAIVRIKESGQEKPEGGGLEAREAAGTLSESGRLSLSADNKLAVANALSESSGKSEIQSVRSRVKAEGDVVTGVKPKAKLAGGPGAKTDVLSMEEIQKIKKLILVTAHRRESFGPGLEKICRAILKILDRFEEAEVIFPVHLNPAVRQVVFRLLRGRPRIHLVEPLDYITFVQLMKRASLILTDSGGIQEEAPSLGVPVVVMRETTERPEAIQAGVAWLAGTDTEQIVRLAVRLLKKVEKGEFRRQLRRKSPFGDGRAGQRIAHLLKKGDTILVSLFS
ncbi:MAG: non-hydrolyzing UDP-N-acetylglucosamine 2-epimerase [Candidatus Saccharicenans sp.]|uniref:non-hydrolyzing UDP-N-acetylglucosamine 2-epimerase n=1 Tax=Candidatus Saccharicenans sp. TaxID=2819258 RepID=UPI00404A99AE